MAEHTVKRFHIYVCSSIGAHEMLYNPESGWESYTYDAGGLEVYPTREAAEAYLKEAQAALEKLPAWAMEEAKVISFDSDEEICEEPRPV